MERKTIKASEVDANTQVKVTFIGGFKSRNFVTKQVEEGK
jgi:hypothetical protein